MTTASRIRSVVRLLAALVAGGLAVGMLAAGLALPAVAGLGAAANQGVHLFDRLPGTFAMNPLAQQTRILAADGSLIATPFNTNRIVVPLDQVAPVMRQAQVAIEDARFFQHGPVDPRSLLRAAAADTVGGGGTQGASTLTEQYVKVALQDRALAAGNQAAARRAVAHTGVQAYLRKLQQLKYATTLEQHYTKDQILDGYLNLVYYGDQQYGIEAAARHYFDVHAAALTLPQAALLAGVVNQPGTTDPVGHPRAAVARRNLVLTRMYQLKLISHRQLASATHTRLRLHITPVSTSCAASKYPYFCYTVTAWLLDQPALGKTPAQREATLHSSGLTIRTSFDPHLAAIIHRQVTAKVPTANPSDVQAAAVIIQPGTGLILASGQNTTYRNTAGPGATSINYTAPAALGGGQGFTFGSTAKLFAIITALSQGLPANTTIDVPPATGVDADGQFHTFTRQQVPGPCGLRPDERWVVHNDAPVPPGPMTYPVATGQSVNTAFAALVGYLGVCQVRHTMTRFGLTQGDGAPLNTTPSGIVLGTNPVAPMTLANAYATIAAGGTYCPPRPVKAITDSRGRALHLAGTGCRQLVSPDLAAATSQIFTSVFSPGSTAGPTNALAGGRPAAGKTGTVTGATQTWFVGYTPQLATAVWVGHANQNARLKDVTLGTHDYPGYIYGATLAAPIWKTIMDQALQGHTIASFPTPSDQILYGPDQTTVPAVTGDTITAATHILRAAGFHVTLGAPATSTLIPTGLITGTTPTTGDHVTTGRAVTIYPSSGQTPDTPPATTPPSP